MLKISKLTDDSRTRCLKAKQSTDNPQFIPAIEEQCVKRQKVTVDISALLLILVHYKHRQDVPEPEHQRENKTLNTDGAFAAKPCSNVPSMQ